ncbi:MAG: tetratricopeptide repeat protein [Rhodoplanes sp.]
MDLLKDADGRDPNVAFMRGLGLLMRGDEASVKAAEDALGTAAAANHTLADALLGRLLVTAPKGITKNVDEGRRLIEAAAASGDPQGQRVAAIAFISAEFGSFQPDRAASLFKKAAEAGDPQAMFHYARVLSEGIGVPPDPAGAMDFLGRAAAAGLTSAQLTIGEILLEQYEAKTLSDPADTVAWFERAMQKGFSWLALNKLQRLYGWAGRDAPWNDKARYFELAKQCSGLAEMYCQYSYSIAFQNGWGTAKDAFRAYVHALIARDLGHPNLKAETIDALGNLLTAKERADAAERARMLRQKLKPAPTLVVFQYPEAVRSSPWASVEDIEKGTPSQQSQPAQQGGGSTGELIAFDEYMSKPSGFYYWRIAFDPAAFNDRPPQLKAALRGALAAYRSKQPTGILEALRGADASDHAVNLLKGIATLRLSDDPPDMQVRGQLEAEVARYLRMAANAGDDKATAILASLLTMKLRGVPPDIQQASEFAERAARSNDAFAVRQLAIGVLSGAFGAANPTRAADLMWTAAELGDPAANAMVAAFFQNGTGVPQDAEKAEKYLRRAAELGYTDAQRVLGNSIVDRYANKNIASPAEGVRLLEKALTSGRSIWSALRLALFYGDVGREPPWRDRPKGLEYARLCIPYSYASCHFAAAAYLAGGGGIAADRARSWAHYSVARELGSTDAVARLESLEKAMTTNELNSARDLSRAIIRDLKPIPNDIEIQETISSASALSPAPAVPASASNYADELTDWGIRPQTNLKYDVGSKTPISIPGGRRITTQDMKDMGQQALVLDVLDERTGHYTIPGAIHLPGAGNYGNGHFADRLQDSSTPCCRA